MPEVETVIIGGGVSGMACGKTLHEQGESFLLLTKELGGRMLTSQSHLVNYGASYVTSDYEHVLPFMSGGARLRIRDCSFLNGSRCMTFFGFENLLALPKLLRLWLVARDYRRRLNALRHRALREQQKDILASDPVLSRYVATPAAEFVEALGLEKLNDEFFGPLFHSTGFIEYQQSNAFHYLDNLMPIFCKTWVADHRNCCKVMARGWGDRIRFEAVTGLQRCGGNGYEVTSSERTYRARNVVLGLPYTDAKRLWPIPQPEHDVPIHVIEVAGERRRLYRGKKVVFFRPQEHAITILWRQVTGSDIIFSKIADPPLEDYYEHHSVIKQIHWDTAAVLSGRRWVEQDLGDGLYLASDYNICGLEDAYITGVYAANRIVERGRSTATA